ncbi:uncharacterized protein LOC133198519 [Saccostrea echinata]|uniref:uncharacterized protein LOC133198519 n=1 Tax=Saccostrea echinata TaxID=191078 RepID=UPI002A7F4F88|nr:uncharacterized protein LOC133198519 [Saccostrea echinata]
MYDLTCIVERTYIGSACCPIQLSLIFSSEGRKNEPTLTRHHHSKQKRFNFPGGSNAMMGGGGGPFHGGGPNMSPMGGSLSHGPMSAPSMSSGMRGPHPPGGGMGMSMGGPRSPGHASMFNPAQCLTQIKCPQWCLMVDEFGCHSCPCGPGGGMMGMSGGSFMSGMPSMGGVSFAHVNQGTKTKVDCIGVELCKSTCQGQYTIGPIGSDGCPSCECNTVSGYLSGGSFGGGAISGGYAGGSSIIGGSSVTGGGSTGVSGGSHIIGGSSVASSGSTAVGGSGGTITGIRPSVGVSTGTNTQTTYIVAPTKECRTEQICRESCGSNFQIGEAGKDGCGTCVCIKPSVTYIPQVVTLTCPSLTCNYGCSVGYKCGTDGCPTCDCALPSGYATHEVVIQHKVDCTTSFSCPTSCDVGYKCGLDGCPTCECLVGYVQTQTTDQCIDCEYIDFLTPTPETVTYIQTVPKQTQTVYVTGGNVCNDCDVTPQMVSYVKPRPQTQTVYVSGSSECHDCDVTPQMVSYVKPRPQKQTVYVTSTNECHDCEPVKPQMVSYVKPRPDQQTLYVTGTQTNCNGCEKLHTYYIQKPTPQKVYVQKPDTENGIPIYIDRPRPQKQTVYVQKPDTENGIPIYIDRPRPQKQTVVVTQTQKCHNSNTCGSGSSSGSSGGVIMNVLTGGSGYISSGSGFSSVDGGGSRGGGGGGTPYGISGGSSVYSKGRVIGPSGSGSGRIQEVIFELT